MPPVSEAAEPPVSGAAAPLTAIRLGERILLSVHDRRGASGILPLSQSKARLMLAQIGYGIEVADWGAEQVMVDGIAFTLGECLAIQSVLSAALELGEQAA